MQVKVLSVKNPYAYLIIQGGKDVENRTWTTDYRGRLYIHVSGDTLPFLTEEPNLTDDYSLKLEIFLNKLAEHYSKCDINKGDTAESFMNAVIDKPNLWLLKTQSIIGYVNLVNIIQNSSSPWAIDGQHHWILKNPTLLENPIRHVKGRLGLWNYNLPE